MKCGHPTQTPHGRVACGQCGNCRVNHKRMWTGRILLEAAEYKTGSSFVTLTYDEENLPYDQSVRRSELRRFIRRCREGPIGKVRYFGVGEYGSKTHRPHYHVILFGFTPWEWENPIREAWRLGNVHVGELTPRSAAYTAQYCFKKTADVENRPGGKAPEFKLYSQKPTLGSAGLARIRDLCYSRHGSAILAKIGDVPNSFRIQGKEYPISRNDIRKLREELFPNRAAMPKGSPQWEWYIEYDEEKKLADKIAQKRFADIADKRFARRNANTRIL